MHFTTSLLAVMAIRLLVATAALAQGPPRQPVRPFVTTLKLPRRPYVVGLTYAAAESTLARFLISVVARESLATTGVSGVVMRQIPDSGTIIRRGAVDTLIVVRTKTRAFTATPDVVKGTYAAAVARVKAQGLVPVGPALSPADSARAGVDTQSPAPARKVPLGSIVRIGAVLDTQTTVPNVQGRDIAMARAILARFRLRIGPMTLGYDDLIPAGSVTHQDPAPNVLVVRGSAVALAVSEGRHPDTTVVVVPSVVRLSVDKARELLALNRLQLSHVDTIWSEKGDGLIVHQRPHERERAHIGDGVIVVVATPPQTVPVPHLVGLTPTRASDTLGRLGLMLGARRFASDPAAQDDVVVSQFPPPGDHVQPGGAINVVINQRPKLLATVPDVRNLQYPTAVDSLIHSGLSVGIPLVRQEVTPGLVVDQQPRPFTQVPAGTPVTLVVGPTDTSTTPSVLVPAVVDSELSWSLRALNSAGLKNVLVDSEPVPPSLSMRGHVAAWIVDSQAPGPGEEVLPSTPVRLVKRAQVTVPTPALIGMSEADARAEAAGEEFPLRVDHYTRSLRLAGRRVKVQVPAADSLVPPGTSIAVTISEPVALPIVWLAGSLVVVLGAAGAIRVIHPYSLHTTARSQAPLLTVPPGGQAVRADISFALQLGPIDAAVVSPHDRIIRKDIRLRGTFNDA